jgi:serine protease Do
VGSKVDVQVIRQGKEITIPITIAELPGDDELKTSSKESGAPIKDNRLAVSVADLDEKARKALDVPEGGVVVEAVSDGPARTAGVRKGDVILMLDSNKIKDVAHFKEVVKALKPGQAAPLLVQRQGSPVFLALRVPGE